MNFVVGPNTLTFDEYLAARSSIYYSPFFFADGRGNMTPEALIAEKRGARFDNNGPLTWKDMKIINKAMNDLASYLGFPNTDAYLEALPLERNAIFDRVNNGNA